MELKYKSRLGEIKTYTEWHNDAKRFYSNLNRDEYSYSLKNEVISIPLDWFERYSRVLKLEPYNE